MLFYLCLNRSHIPWIFLGGWDHAAAKKDAHSSRNLLSCCFVFMLLSKGKIAETDSTCCCQGLTSSHFINLLPFFRLSGTHTGLSCSAWTPGCAPAIQHAHLPPRREKKQRGRKRRGRDLQSSSRALSEGCATNDWWEKDLHAREHDSDFFVLMLFLSCVGGLAVNSGRLRRCAR